MNSCSGAIYGLLNLLFAWVHENIY